MPVYSPVIEPTSTSIRRAVELEKAGQHTARRTSCVIVVFSMAMSERMHNADGFVHRATTDVIFSSNALQCRSVVIALFMLLA